MPTRILLSKGWKCRTGALGYITIFQTAVFFLWSLNDCNPILVCFYVNEVTHFTLDQAIVINNRTHSIFDVTSSILSYFCIRKNYLNIRKFRLFKILIWKIAEHFCIMFFVNKQRKITQWIQNFVLKLYQHN